MNSVGKAWIPPAALQPVGAAAPAAAAPDAGALDAPLDAALAAAAAAAAAALGSAGCCRAFWVWIQAAKSALLRTSITMGMKP